MEDFEYAGEPKPVERKALTQRNQESEEEQTAKVEEFVVERSFLKLILTQVKLIPRNWMFCDLERISKVI